MSRTSKHLGFLRVTRVGVGLGRVKIWSHLCGGWNVNQKDVVTEEQ